MNFLAVMSLCLTFTDAAENVLDISGIRLVNGSGQYGGRVEIQIYGVWGTVCDDSFSISDAAVMCRMMNLKASMYMTGARYGQGIGPIFAQEFNCTGNETHLKNCPYVLNERCSHARDIGIICSECPQISISNGDVVDISADGSILSAICHEGFTSNTTTSKCINGLWSPPAITCIDVDEFIPVHIYNFTDIRLVNGLGLFDGRVELLVNGTWGTICGTHFGPTETVAICRILFGSKFTFVGYIQYYTTSVNYGPGEGPIYIDELDCDSSATSINECSYKSYVSCTDHTRDAAVACNVRPLNITATRLVNGTGPYDGRIELFVDGYWGTICNRHISMFDAKTICKTHNRSLAMYFTEAIYGKGTGPVLIDYISCFQSSHIKFCRSVYSPFRPFCSHDFDLSIVCTSCGLPNIYNGEAFSFNNTALTVKCKEGFFPDFIIMRCLDNGTWMEDQRCTSYNELGLSAFPYWDAGFFMYNGSILHADCSYYKTYLGTLNLVYYNDTKTWVTEGECQEYRYPLIITDIRLADGPRTSQGRVEIKSLNTWGTICDNNFGITEANLICKMVGHTRAVTFLTNAFYGEGKGPIFADDLDCKDSATEFNDCTYKTYDDCTHGDDISVVCTDCRDPTPENGFAYILWSTNQISVNVTCKQGHKLIGDENIICLSNGTWSNLPACKLIDCGDPTPVHGSSNNSNTTNGTVTLIYCEQGYYMTGDAIITCQPDETWTDTPACVSKEEAVGVNANESIIILAMCLGISVVTNVGLVIVTVRCKRNATTKTVDESTMAGGMEAENDHNTDNPTNMYQTRSERSSDTNLYESLREQVGEQISMNELAYDILKPSEHPTRNTEEEHRNHNCC